MWCFCFTVHTLCSGLFERFSVQRIYSGFKVLEAGIFFTETSDYLSEILWSSYRPCSQIWHLCHICWMFCSITKEILTLSGTPEFTPFGEFMISPIHYIYMYIIYYWICSVLGLCLRINDSGLFAWISPTDFFVSDLFYNISLKYTDNKLKNGGELSIQLNVPWLIYLNRGYTGRSRSRSRSRWNVICTFCNTWILSMLTPASKLVVFISQFNYFKTSFMHLTSVGCASWKIINGCMYEKLLASYINTSRTSLFPKSKYNLYNG